MSARTLTIYTDGGARGNPGPAAIGVVIEEHGKIIESFGRFVGEKLTNNQAEYLAVSAALERARELGADMVNVHLDSELVTQQLRRMYRVRDKDLAPLFVQAWNASQKFKRVSFTHVAREQNRLADSEVNKALDAAGYYLKTFDT